ncbi:F-box protein [Aspergillus lucknowensis]|uniref:F-box domain-containing protein n=1 Tax=Aspergillus lucknowensis TaxID=176173 RepID=A0ABR4LIA0_9EURO
MAFSVHPSIILCILCILLICTQLTQLHRPQLLANPALDHPHNTSASTTAQLDMTADFTAYCAICAAQFSLGCIGAGLPRALRIRRARVARRRYWKAKDCNCDNTEDEEEEDRAERKRYVASVLPEGDELLDDTDDADSVQGYNYDHGYDPNLIGLRDMRWMTAVYGLGIDHRRPGPRRYFIATFTHEDGNWFCVHNPDEDPELPEDMSDFFSYGVSDLDDPPMFPFHRDCLELLTRAVLGTVDTNLIQKDILYKVMEKIGSWTVTCPNTTLNLEPLIPENLTSTPKSIPDLSTKVISDPFKSLPYEMIHNILDYLPAGPLMAVREASWTVRTHTQSSRFWKRRIDTHMPWFWELHEYISKNKDQELNYQGLYLFLEKETRPSYGMTGPFMGVANRRRVWGVCMDLRERYERLIQEEAAEMKTTA